jgi:hypothetical protein
VCLIVSIYSGGISKGVISLRIFLFLLSYYKWHLCSMRWLVSKQAASRLLSRKLFSLFDYKWLVNISFSLIFYEWRLLITIYLDCLNWGLYDSGDLVWFVFSFFIFLFCICSIECKYKDVSSILCLIRFCKVVTSFLIFISISISDVLSTFCKHPTFCFESISWVNPD